jgi:hypothetical protein
MTREQMIGVLEDYCNKNICDSSCEFVHDCKRKDFSKMSDDELKMCVERIAEIIGINTESQNTCELVGKRMEQVKVLKKVTRMTYPNRMEVVIPIKEFVKNITDKGYKVMITRENVISGKYDVVVYEEVEMKE